jgi:predicted Abi (CAAX) family protease
VTDARNLPPRDPPRPIRAALASLRRLPDVRAAIEGVILFLVVILAGAWAVQMGVLVLAPVPRENVAAISLTAFFLPALIEELVFRSWLPRGAPFAAIASFVAFILWHPLQVILNLPFARPEFSDASFLGLVAWLGLACTLARVRSGSIWPGVVIHWGAVVVWLALFSGDAAAGGGQPG